MPKITGFIHIYGPADAPPLARALESLRVCDEILIIDHLGTDEVNNIVRQYATRVKPGIPGVSPGAYLVDASHDWILCLLAREALSEALEAALFQWKDTDHDTNAAYSAPVRLEIGQTWHELHPETRLVNRNAVNWTGELPGDDPRADVLDGHILRFSTP